MKSKIIITFLIAFILLLAGIAVYFFFLNPAPGQWKFLAPSAPRREVIGFLPYWLISRAGNNYSPYITNLVYFSLSLNGDGSIQKYTRPQESEPGYHTLVSGKADAILSTAKDLDLSLAVFAGDNEVISALLDHPRQSALNMLAEITPLMRQYGFSELNLDIEYIGQASPEARLRFLEFVRTVRDNLDPKVAKTLSVDVTASSFIKDTHLSDPFSLAQIADRLIIMAYDFHYRGSYVTGPVAPAEGAGIVSEFDTRSAIESALLSVPRDRLILGIPLYGYEWETIGDTPRSAVIAGTGLTISNSRAEEFLASCATCSAEFDSVNMENHIIYRDGQTGTYHQIFFPDIRSTRHKVKMAGDYSLGGIALWALGYEGGTILEPLSSYRN